MSPSPSPLFAAEVIACMGEGRAPTDAETLLVAQRIWSDGAAARSAFAWDGLPAHSPDRVGSIRAALVALNGIA